MWLFSLNETLAMLAAAVALDWWIGDPRWPTHPVIRIGRLIARLERVLLRAADSPAVQRLKGAVLTAVTVGLAYAVLWGMVRAAFAVHPWLGYALNTWFISTTVAVKGLKDAALDVYRPLAAGDLPQARQAVGRIVGRDTAQLEEGGVVRAAVETVAENTVDAVVSPLFYALLGGAPLAMLYRAANTLDSMVGYKNEKYRWFGWASARWDDALNWIPARLAGLLLAASALLTPGLAAGRAVRAVAAFARLHPSPNSGIPESAVAGALGVELGGRNTYGGVASVRARMGWPLRPLGRDDIPAAVGLLYKVSYWIVGGSVCALAVRLL